MWWKKITFSNYFLAALILSIVSAVGILFIKNLLPPVIPIFYGKPVGTNQLGTYWLFLIIPGASLLITVVNLLAGVSIKDEFVKKILAVSALIIAIMATVTIVKIILLVGLF